jgi:indolepyruvate ferredoxin oxidoreductase
MPAAIEIAAAADLIAGYGPVKEAGVEAYHARVAGLLPKLDAVVVGAPVSQPAAPVEAGA